MSRSRSSSKLRLLGQILGPREIRNSIVGFVFVVGGLLLAALTFYVHRTGDPRIATILAALSLTSVLVILIFVMPPLVRNAGREAAQLNLPFEFTAGGLIFFLLIAVVGFSAWNTGNNLLFLILSFLVSALVVGFLAGSLSLKKLDVRMRFPETIFADEVVPLIVGVTNRKRLLPAFSVIVDVRGKQRERSIAASDLERILPKWIAARWGRPPLVRRTLDRFDYVAARGEVEVKVEHKFPERGRLIIKDFELSTRFPFGFFRHRRRLPAREAELFVFPRITSSSEWRRGTPTESGLKTLGVRGAGLDLLALRAYRLHDDLRSIDWKATAKTRELVVREFAAEEEKSVTVVLDDRVSQDESVKLSIREKLALEQSGKNLSSEPFENGVGLAASTLLALAAEDANFRLIIGRESGNYGMGRQHLHDCLKRLAVAEPVFAADDQDEPKASNSRIPDEGSGQIVLITNCDTEDVLLGSREKLNVIRF